MHRTPQKMCVAIYTNASFQGAACAAARPPHKINVVPQSKCAMAVNVPGATFGAIFAAIVSTVFGNQLRFYFIQNL